MVLCQYKVGMWGGQGRMGVVAWSGAWTQLRTDARVSGERSPLRVGTEQVLDKMAF